MSSNSKMFANCLSFAQTDLNLIRWRKGLIVMHTHRYEIADEQWIRIESLFPPYSTGRPVLRDNRTMLNAVLWLNWTGTPWRDLPARFDPWKSVYTRLSCWGRDGVLECFFHALREDADMEYLHIDSTAVIAHQHSAGAKQSGPQLEDNHIGRSVGGNSTKIHELGNPVEFLLTEDNRHDGPVALELLKTIQLTGVNVIADKANGGKAIREFITNQGGRYTIPPKDNNPKPWSVDWWIYKERHSVECFFNRLKHFRRVATRYDKTTV